MIPIQNLDYQLGLGHKVERSDPTRVFEPEGIIWSGVHCGMEKEITLIEIDL